MSTNQTIEYSTDGDTWNSMTTATTVTLTNSGDSVYVRGVLSGANTFSNYTNFTMSGNIKASGNINYLWNKDNPNSTLKQYCGYKLFGNCTVLSDISELELPSTTLSEHCYRNMFSGCTSLTTVPVLPATRLSDYCYTYMFVGCTNLVSAPSLPATRLALWCYAYMFSGCTSLTTAPALPSTTLEPACYTNMFQGCTSLTTAPQISATTLAGAPGSYDWTGCCQRMFSDCTSLINAPELHATNATIECYAFMFENCTSLVNAPALPAETLDRYCYQGMFKNCTSLTTAPVLQSQKLNKYSYANMFSGCTQLNYIKCLATDISAENCTNGWVSGVSETGTFVKNENMHNWTTGVNGIPDTWVVEDTPVPLSSLSISGTTNVRGFATFYPVYIPAATTEIGVTWSIVSGNEYAEIDSTTGELSALSGANSSSVIIRATSVVNSAITSDKTINVTYIPSVIFTAKQAGSTIKLAKLSTNQTIQYCMDSSTTWYNLTTATTITLNSIGNKVFIRGVLSSNNTSSNYTKFTMSGDIKASGNINYLWNKDNADAELKQYCGCNLFSGCTALSDASELELPSTTLAYYCYTYMFRGCTSLATAPALPATELTGGCYYYMFDGCTSLTSAPVLPATTLASWCYYGMFYNCTNLNYIKCLATNKSATSCTTNWVSGVSATGTFIKDTNMTGWTTGVSGIPNGWQTGCELDVDEFVTFTAKENGSTVGLSKIYGDVYYTFDESYFNSIWYKMTTATTITLENVGDKVYVIGKVSNNSSSNYKQFKMTGNIKASGNINALFDYSDLSLQLKNYCGYKLFNNCTALTDVTELELPATTLAQYCYGNMFQGCTSLTEAPELPATTLAGYCYYFMFNGCTSLTTAPTLSATTLANNCYNAMFSGCTSLTTTPALPAITLASSCYSNMFQGCTSLTEAPELPATTLAVYCYYFMFNGCTSLTTAPTLSAITLASSCYSNMFQGCTLLTEAPTLPATTLAGYCYTYMFHGCTSLTEAPELPATTLASSCYSNMFQGCISLTTAPALPATTLVQNCYYQMFYGCTNLNYIKCLATDISAAACTTNWVNNVNTNGTFIKAADKFDWTVGVNGIPENWLVQTNAIKFTLHTIGSTLGLNSLFTGQTLEYSLDGETFVIMDTATTITADVSDKKVYVRGIQSSVQTENDYTNFAITGDVSVSGKLNSLFNYNNLDAALKPYCANGMFANCTGLTNSNELVLAKEVNNYCYLNMFSGCTHLTTIPTLYQDSVSTGCYKGMFFNCTSLTTPPELKSKNLATSCYEAMFAECTALEYTPKLPATILFNSCYKNMFSGCTTLDNKQKLVADILVDNCYEGMFNGCIGINEIVCLASSISATDCTTNWVNNVSVNGTFTKISGITWTIGVDGIPSGWTAQDYVDPSEAPYIMFTSNEDASSVGMHSIHPNQELQYSYDKVNWNNLSSTSQDIILNDGDVVYMRGILTESYTTGETIFRIDGNVAISGNLAAIWNYSNLDAPLQSMCGMYMFGGEYENYCSGLTDASELALPSMNLAEHCYEGLFKGCINLVNAPSILPATTLSDYCYSGMFRDCTSLTTAPALPATTLADNCYYSMFQGCTSLTEAPTLPATTLASHCYEYMFSGCTSLTEAPTLPATTLVDYCYKSMFENCTNLNYIKCLATDISANGCVMNWTVDVASVGTFVKPYEMNSWRQGTQGIPYNWTVENIIPEWVEIGGVKWAKWNNGAESETDYGLYYQWGDTQGYSAEQVGTNKDFNWDSYKYAIVTPVSGSGSGDDVTITKYNPSDGKTRLDISDDAMNLKYGGNWRLPTIAEYEALSSAVTTAWTENYQGSGVAGLVCTDKTDSSKVLFFPAAGNCENGNVYGVGSRVCCWCSSRLDSGCTYAYYLKAENDGVNWAYSSERYYGCSVRGVLGDTIPLTSLTISGKSDIINTSDYTVNYNPNYTTQTGVTWSIVSGSEYATIDSNGMVMVKSGASNNTVVIRATSNVNSNIYVTKTITVTWIVYVNSLTISGNANISNSATYTVAYTPYNTTQTAVTWSISSGSQYATIDSTTGVLTVLSGVTGNSVVVRVQSVDNPSVYATKSITVNQIDYVEIAGIKWAKWNYGSTSVTDPGTPAAQNTSINWGTGWYLPSIYDIWKLESAVTTAWTSSYEGSGVSGIICTDKTDSSKKLFFPGNGRYWSGTHYDDLGGETKWKLFYYMDSSNGFKTPSGIADVNYAIIYTTKYFIRPAFK